MKTQYVYNLKNADKVFPNTKKIRPHDIPKIVETNINLLGIKGMKKLGNIQNEIYEGKLNNHFEFYAKASKNKLKLIPFD